jgi:hypothetical protein
MTILNENTTHLSDEEILLLVDNEMSQHKIQGAEQHLANCLDCRSRRLRMERSLAELEEFGQLLDAQLPNATGPRSLLKAQLKNASGSTHIHWHERLMATLQMRPRSYVYAALGIVVLTTFLLARQSVMSRPGIRANQYQAALEPDHRLTPGAARPVSLIDICPLNDDDLDPNVSPSKRQAVFEAYGIAAKAAAKDYQVDYLINPQLGGTDDISNLWPEPYNSATWNARAKDALEKRLHKMVCEQQIDLASAQSEIATDWIAAYKKYFHSANPV